MLSLLIIDSSASKRCELKKLLEMKYSNSIITLSKSQLESERLIRNHKYDIIVISLVIKSVNTFSLISNIKKWSSESKILVTGAKEHHSFIPAIYMLGVNGFINYNQNVNDYQFAFDALLDGHPYFDIKLLSFDLPPKNRSIVN